ncbi:hypothetical protein EVAR_16217_1 [Eumeta japonica]|uniref:Uncharacterized protein n=1 Tax=Eumeta variegata TaxID=151549 RepID=A0A4C1U5X7_EUMVA|nr:hypothetical protein EVAR_16217_1 [Eumeta japonica]
MVQAIGVRADLPCIVSDNAGQPRWNRYETWHQNVAKRLASRRAEFQLDTDERPGPLRPPSVRHRLLKWLAASTAADALCHFSARVCVWIGLCWIDNAALRNSKRFE